MSTSMHDSSLSAGDFRSQIESALPDGTGAYSEDRDVVFKAGAILVGCLGLFAVIAVIMVKFW